MNSVVLLTLVYNAMIGVAVWTLLVPWQLIKIVLKRGTMEELKMRLGFVTLEKNSGVKRCVVHGVSVGEVKAAEILIAAIEGLATNLDIILTAGNRDGFRTATEAGARFRSIRNVLFLPWDTKGSMRRWLRAIQPDIVVNLETELWPNLFLCCRERGIPLYIVSGRIYPRDIPRYRMARSLFAQTLSCANWIGVQSDAEQQHFLSIGAPAHLVHVAGNLKLAPLRPLHRGLDARVKHLDTLAHIIVAGSTHHPEEEWILEAFKSLKRTIRDLRIVIAPRHVSRSDSILSMIRSRGLNGILWSSFDPPANHWDVLVLNEMGWLTSIYEYATVAVIGGSFVHHGGHNPAEAAMYGKPVVVGPSMHHFSPMLETFLEGRGILKLDGHNQLESALLALLLDAGLRKQLGGKARKVIEESSGGAEDYAIVIMRGMGLEPRKNKQAILETLSAASS